MAEERRTSSTKRDVNRVIARWYTTVGMLLNYGRTQFIAYIRALIPALKKLCPNKGDIIPVLQRRLELSNANATADGLILGTMLAVEEGKANSPDTIFPESIVAVKIGLIGSVAALEDSFDAGTIATLFILALCSLTQGDSIIGFWLLLLGTVHTLGELAISIKTTYTKGRSAIRDIMSSKSMNNVIEGTDVLGIVVVGALTASMANLAAATTVNFDEATLGVQEKIDGIMPGILSIGVLFIYYYLISRKYVSVAKLVFFATVIALLCAAIGSF